MPDDITPGHGPTFFVAARTRPLHSRPYKTGAAFAPEILRGDRRARQRSTEAARIFSLGTRTC